MLIERWRRGPVVWRFAATVAAVMAVAMGSLGLFFAFGGVWAQPPLQRTGFFEQHRIILRMVEAAPPALRPAIAAAARPAKFDVIWLPAGSPSALALDRLQQPVPDRDRPALRRVMDYFGPDRPIRVVVPGVADHAPPLLPDGTPVLPPGHALAVGLADGGWLVSVAAQRFWGLDPPALLSGWLAVLLLATAAVSLLAARQLGRPIQRFAEAIRLFGAHPTPAPLEERGPAEFRAVIAAFNVMQERIQRLMSHRTATLAAISHDLRTPLTRIRLRGEFIQDPVQRERLFRDVDDLQRMVDGALAFFRGDAQEEKVTPLDLPSLLQTIVDDFADEGITIPYRGPARLQFLGRPLALKRAFGNVIENAVKYATPPEVRLLVEAGQVTVSIRDLGPGIPEPALERVFHPFFRLESSRNRATGGVGLGLTAAQSILREHGGDIVLANRPGGGLEARIVLPRL